jgi:tetratricopeptide (TPR) repeat protein
MFKTPAKKLHEEGGALFRKGQFEQARQRLDEALQAAEPNSRQVAEIYNDLGVVQQQLEDFEAAHAALDEAMDRFVALEDQKGQAQTLGNRAAIYEAEELYEEAVETYKESAGILEAIGENELAMYVWQAISRLRMRQKQYIAAIGAYEEGVENMPEGSFKRKILSKILSTPGALLGGSAKGDDEPDDDE